MKLHLGILVMIAGSLLTAGAARAQNNAAQQRPDTAALRTNQPVTYVRGRNRAPSSVRQVRRRIARIGIGSGPGVRRIVYPIIIPGGRPTAPRAAQPPRPPAAAPPPPSAPATGLTQRDLSRLENRLLDRFDRRFDALYDALNAPRQDRPDISVRFRDEDEAAQEEQPPPPPAAPEQEAREQAPPPLIARPTVRTIERAILETGLFRAVGINFEFDESTLLPTAEPPLDAVGEVLRKYPALRIEIAGHTDAIGSDAYNQQLSEARARSVRRYLVQNAGVDAGRLEVRGYGESQPIASNDDPTGRTLNRRVSFRVLNPEAAEQYIETTTPEPDTTAQPPPDTSSSSNDNGLGNAEREALRESIRQAARQALRERQGLNDDDTTRTTPSREPRERP